MKIIATWEMQHTGHVWKSKVFFLHLCIPKLVFMHLQNEQKKSLAWRDKNARVFSVCNYLYTISISFFAHWMSTTTTKKFTRNGQFGIQRGGRDVVAIWCSCSPYERAGEILLFLFDIIMNVTTLCETDDEKLITKTFFASARRDKKEFFSWIFAGQHFSGGWNLLKRLTNVIICRRYH